MKHWAIGIIALGYFSAAEARDLGFRYVGTKCVNGEGREGLNPSHFGQCGDFRGVTLSRLDLSGLDLSGTAFTGSDLQRTNFENTTLYGVAFDDANLAGAEFSDAKVKNSNFARSNLKNSSFGNAQIEASTFVGADFAKTPLSFLQAENCDFTGVVFDNSTLDEATLRGSNFSGATFARAGLRKADFRGANLSKAVFEASILDGADLSGVQGAEVKVTGSSAKNVNFRMADLVKGSFKNSDLSGSVFSGAKVTDVELGGTNLLATDIEAAGIKGAKFSKRTQLPFSSERALELGMLLQKIRTVFVLWDQRSTNLDTFAKALKEMDVEVTLSDAAEFLYDGTRSLSEFDAVLHLNGSTYATDMDVKGQMAILAFVKGGGTLIYGEWNNFEFRNGRLQQWRDLILLETTNVSQNTISLTATAGMESHPILEGLGTNFSVTGEGLYWLGGTVIPFATNPVSVLLKDPAGNAAVVLRKVDAGLVVALGSAATFNGAVGMYLDAKFQRLVANAINNGL